MDMKQYDFSPVQEFISQMRNGEFLIVKRTPEERYVEVPSRHTQFFLNTLEDIFELVEAEVGRLAESVQFQKRQQEPLEERIEQLGRYIDALIIKNYGPGTYKFGEELWTTGEDTNGRGGHG